MPSMHDSALGDLVHGVGMPSSWRYYLVSLGVMLALAGLDFAGAIFAKEWVERQHAAFYLAGLFTVGVLFTVYAASLKVEERSYARRSAGWCSFRSDYCSSTARSGSRWSRSWRSRRS